MKDDEQQIRELVSTWMKATKEGDSETVLSLMADDAKFLVAGKPPFDKEIFSAAASNQGASEIEIDGQSEVLEINIIGDYAVIITELTVTMSQKGLEKAVRKGNTLTVLSKRNGKWLLFRDANLLVPVT